MPATSSTAVRSSKPSIHLPNKDVLGKQETYQGIQSSSEAKKKNPSPRPNTPSPSAKIEGNKAVSKKTIRSSSPVPTLKRSATPHGRTVTSREKQPSTLKSVKQSGSKSSTITRSASPPAPTTHHASAHATSHQATAHRRSHERVPSPDKSLLEENRRLQRLLDERNKMLNERDE
ncbi:8039_t:CDS:2, partial [Racocetra persica]